MGGHINQRTLIGKSQDAILSHKSDRIITSYAANLAIEKELLRKAHVTSKKERRLSLDNHRHVPRRVTRCGHHEHIAALYERPALLTLNARQGRDGMGRWDRINA
jgi:hypothetical protein